jgi:hypothetical protein
MMVAGSTAFFRCQGRSAYPIVESPAFIVRTDYLIIVDPSSLPGRFEDPRSYRYRVLPWRDQLVTEILVLKVVCAQGDDHGTCGRDRPGDDQLRRRRF